MNSKTSEKVFRAIFFLYIFVILILATIRIPETATTGIDKIDHAAAFIVFSLLMRFSFRNASPVLIFFSGFGFGIMIEIIQLFIPYRSAEILDVAANIAGLLIGGFLVKIIRNRQKHK
jgi:VanZ family protein